jgi:hypothetical protein
MFQQVLLNFSFEVERLPDSGGHGREVVALPRHQTSCIPVYSRQGIYCGIGLKL